MWIGIDFGTSYSAAAAIVDGRLRHVPFGPRRQFRTAAYFPRELPAIAAFALTPALEREVEALVRDGRRGQDAGRQPLTEAQLRDQALRSVRSRWLQDQHRREVVARDSLSTASFGEDAIAAYVEDPQGRLFQSPKSMIGFRLMPGVGEVIHAVLTSVLSHVRYAAEEHFADSVDGAVIGRPVRFRSSMGSKGDDQALAMLRAAATAAGFAQVEFMHEPDAAALDFHAGARERQRFLVVDIGGGTSDLCLAEGGGDEPFQPLMSWGEAVGGGDVDYWLNLLQFMGHFGRNIGRSPNQVYSEAAMVSDHVRQAKFRGYDLAGFESPWRERLRTLQSGATTVRLAADAEALKIHLSTHAHGRAALDYIEAGLAIAAVNADLAAAAEPFLRRFEALLDTVRADIDADPARIVLAGGASAAPYIAAAVAARFPGVELVRSPDPGLAIVSGLARASADRAARTG